MTREQAAALMRLQSKYTRLSSAHRTRAIIQDQDGARAFWSARLTQGQAFIVRMGRRVGMSLHEMRASI